MEFEGFAKFRGMLLYNMLIMPALCLMLWYTYYASNYAGIIGASLAFLTLENVCVYYRQLIASVADNFAFDCMQFLSTTMQ